MSNNKMNICLSSDDNYSKYLGTVITSILYNSTEDNIFKFHIIDFGISNENKEKILSLKNIRSFEISFYSIDKEKYNNMYDKFKNHFNTNWLSPAAFGRISIPSIIEEDKVLYLDCDIIVNLNLKEFFDINIDNYYALVCYEHSPDIDYFNSGMMMINCKLWRENNIENALETSYYKNYQKYSFLDQDLLNDVLKGKVKYVDKKYNFFPHINYKPSNISIEEYIEKNKNSIFHYVVKKPWVEDTSFAEVLFIQYYWKYYTTTPWFKENSLNEIYTILKQQDHIQNYIIKIDNKTRKYNMIIDKIAWWIPIKKIRDKIRGRLKIY